MSILIVRRISQVFFLVLFLGFCAVTSLGENWWQLRGWPVNAFLEFDPLVGIGTLLSTQTLYQGLILGLIPVVLTILLGRFFCGWACPFGTLHQFVGYLGRRRKPGSRKREVNGYSRWQAAKYWILFFMLGAAAAELPAFFANVPLNDPRLPWAAAAGALLLLLLGATLHALYRKRRRKSAWILPVMAAAALILVFKDTQVFQGSLQSGLLDPIPLFQRSVNLILLPALDQSLLRLSAASHPYQGAWLIGTIFFAAVFLNLWIPRFYCRYVCPLGALFGLLARHSLWRVGKTEHPCADCRDCETDCEGACAPSSSIVWGECVLCLNCVKACRTRQIAYRTNPSEGGETHLPDWSRRGFVLSLLSGVMAVPLVRAGGGLAANWNPSRVRPPGSLPEREFLSRCIKCGQCMRICPTQVIQPAGLEGGLEGLWTPILDFRMGSSGCRHNCIACGHLCPTSAIRSLSLDERLGRKAFEGIGPVRIGTAFIDRGRCLPWAMDRPCIVCQENCPVSPKAIFTREHFADPRFLDPPVVRESGRLHAVLHTAPLIPGRYETGDYYAIAERTGDAVPRRILKNRADRIEIHPEFPWTVPPAPGSRLFVKIRLQQPWVDIDRCIGCGICEHECPVSGLRAIRVTAENETRHRKHALTPSGFKTLTP